VIELREHLFCLAVPFGGKLLNPRAANGNQREFRGNEEAIGQHQQEYRQQRERRTNRRLLSGDRTVLALAYELPIVARCRTSRIQENACNSSLYVHIRVPRAPDVR
jgi:hypothetical protein